MEACDKKPFYKQTWFFAAVIVLVIIVIVCQQMNKKKPRDALKNKKDKNNKKDKKKSKKSASSDTDDAKDVEEFVASGGRDDIGGGDFAMRDRIHAINAKQQQYILNSKTQYRYDERTDSAAPAIYSPEADLQSALYP